MHHVRSRSVILNSRVIRYALAIEITCAEFQEYFLRDNIFRIATPQQEPNLSGIDSGRSNAVRSN